MSPSVSSLHVLGSEYCSLPLVNHRLSPFPPTLSQAGLVQDMYRVARCGFRRPNTAQCRDDGDFKAGGVHSPSARQFWDTMVHLSSAKMGVQAQVLEWVANGVDVTSFFSDFEGHVPGYQCEQGSHFAGSHPPAVFLPNHIADDVHPVHGSFAAFADNEVKALLESGAIELASTPPTMIMPLSVAASDKKLRLVYDCRALNLFCDSMDVKYPSLVDFARGISQRDLMGSIDLKSGYHSVLIHPDSRHYMGFHYKGRAYVWRALPFGWNAACFVFQTLSDVLTSFLRRLGVHAITYLDDCGFKALGEPRPPIEEVTTMLHERAIFQETDFASTAAWAQHRFFDAAWCVVTVFFAAGYTVNRSKCSLAGATELPFLGLVVNSARLSFDIPQQKRDRVLADVAEILRGEETTINSLQKLAGRLAFLLPAAPVILTFLRPIFDTITLNLRRAHGNKMARVRLTEQLASAIRAFNAISNWESRHSWGRERHAVLAVCTDASQSGLGGVFTTDDGVKHQWQMPIPPLLFGAHIQVLEAAAVFFCLQQSHRLIKGRHLDLFVDNEAVRYALAAWRGSRDSSLNTVITAIYELQLRLRINIHAHRIPTEVNADADFLSRNIGASLPSQTLRIDRGDHMLHPDIFEKLQWSCGRQFTVDLFANEHNRRTPRFYAAAWSFAPEFVGLNALAHDVSVNPHTGEREFVYANPPWVLLGPTLKHLRECRAAGVIVFPDIPMQTWFADIIDRALQIYALANKDDVDVFLHPSRGYHASVGPVPWNLWAARFDFSL